MGKSIETTGDYQWENIMKGNISSPKGISDTGNHKYILDVDRNNGKLLVHCPDSTLSGPTELVVPYRFPFAEGALLKRIYDDLVTYQSNGTEVLFNPGLELDQCKYQDSTFNYTRHEVNLVHDAFPAVNESMRVWINGTYDETDVDDNELWNIDHGTIRAIKAGPIQASMIVKQKDVTYDEIYISLIARLDIYYTRTTRGGHRMRYLKHMSTPLLLKYTITSNVNETKLNPDFWTYTVDHNQFNSTRSENEHSISKWNEAEAGEYYNNLCNFTPHSIWVDSTGINFNYYKHKPAGYQTDLEFDDTSESVIAVTRYGYWNSSGELKDKVVITKVDHDETGFLNNNSTPSFTQKLLPAANKPGFYNINCAILNNDLIIAYPEFSYYNSEKISRLAHYTVDTLELQNKELFYLKMITYPRVTIVNNKFGLTLFDIENKVIRGITFEPSDLNPTAKDKLTISEFLTQPNVTNKIKLYDVPIADALTEYIELPTYGDKNNMRQDLLINSTDLSRYDDYCRNIYLPFICYLEPLINDIISFIQVTPQLTGYRQYTISSTSNISQKYDSKKTGKILVGFTHPREQSPGLDDIKFIQHGPATSEIESRKNMSVTNMINQPITISSTISVEWGEFTSGSETSSNGIAINVIFTGCNGIYANAAIDGFDDTKCRNDLGWGRISNATGMAHLNHNFKLEMFDPSSDTQIVKNAIIAVGNVTTGGTFDLILETKLDLNNVYDSSFRSYDDLGFSLEDVPVEFKWFNDYGVEIAAISDIVTITAPGIDGGITNGGSYTTGEYGDDFVLPPLLTSFTLSRNSDKTDDTYTELYDVYNKYRRASDGKVTSIKLGDFIGETDPTPYSRTFDIVNKDGYKKGDRFWFEYIPKLQGVRSSVPARIKSEIVTYCEDHHYILKNVIISIDGSDVTDDIKNDEKSNYIHISDTDVNISVQFDLDNEGWSPSYPNDLLKSYPKILNIRAGFVNVNDHNIMIKYLNDNNHFIDVVNPPSTTYPNIDTAGASYIYTSTLTGIVKYDSYAPTDAVSLTNQVMNGFDWTTGEFGDYIGYIVIYDDRGNASAYCLTNAANNYKIQNEV